MAGLAPLPTRSHGAVARPDYHACHEVLWAELGRLRPPAPDEVAIAV